MNKIAKIIPKGIDPVEDKAAEPIEVEAKPFIKGQTVVVIDGIYKGKLGEIFDVKHIFQEGYQINVFFYVVIDGYNIIQIAQDLLNEYKPKNDKKGDKKDQNPVKKDSKKEKCK